METKVNYVIVGVFVVVLSTVLIAGVLWLAAGPQYRKTYDVYQTFIRESVSGLNVNAPVKYRGVEVGRVQKIALDPANSEQVRLILDIERGTPVKEDTIAFLRVQGLTGIAYVELKGGSRTSPLLQARPGEKYPTIKSGPSLLARLDDALFQLLGNFNRVSVSINQVLSPENRKALGDTLAHLETLTRTLSARAGTIDATMADMERTTAALPELVDRLGRSAGAVEKMAAELAKTGESVQGLASESRAGVEQVSTATLPEMQRLVTDLRKLTASLQQVSDELEQNPAVLLRGRQPPPPGPGE